MPMFSVVVPAHNSTATLGQTLDSLISQSFVDWEAVILDDASTDGTYELASRYAEIDGRVRVIRLDRSGPSLARNTGVLEFSGAEWIAFLDADDIWAQDKLARTAKEIRATRAAAFYARIAFFRHAPDSATTLSTVKSAALSPYDLLCENAVCTLSNLVVRRDAFLAAGGFDPKVVHGEDVEFMIRLAAGGGRIASIDEVLVYYRASDSGLSADLVSMREGWEAALATMRRLGLPVETAAVRHAQAIHLRYLARRALRVRVPRFTALRLAARAMRISPSGFFSDPRRAVLTVCAAFAEPFMPSRLRRCAFDR